MNKEDSTSRLKQRREMRIRRRLHTDRVCSRMESHSTAVRYTQAPCGITTLCIANSKQATFTYKHTHARTHTRAFNGPFSGTTWVSRNQKCKTNPDFTEARDSEWQWHQLGHMQVCTLLQTDNHASTSPLSFYMPDALPVTQPTASKH